MGMVGCIAARLNLEDPHHEGRGAFGGTGNHPHDHPRRRLVTRYIAVVLYFHSVSSL